ncbi:Phospholipase D [Heracleum sosnowskyi]|uniref:phospholipase D n=1 Tax=Heracleum sosnowskyi TaxID=360622 RepID=A0AAD8HD57_9APIA|nr:Phospholipase D [Heracleum sosnowskyi]
MLVWDDRTSVGQLKKDGLMATHDEETEQFFQGTDVHCVLCPRNPDDCGSIVQGLTISTMFTHHQKIVVMDSEMPNNGSSRQWRIVHQSQKVDLGSPGMIFTPVLKAQLHGISIDGGAAFGFPKTPEDAAKAELVSGKDNIIDRSIQDAYIHAIRRAKHFIYIENQYFLGSSFGWKSDDLKDEDVNALHLIPKELSLTIVSKIESGERFVVYVVVPMWPEGIPESGSVQAILDWQKRSMEMMYKDIIQALQEKGMDDDPREYLTFYCLGNREAKQSGEYKPTEEPEPYSNYLKAQQARRFMIYVHAKMMIVDDEYVIIGSANINQRSLDGARDSEIAMGGYQPHHLPSRQPTRGQVHGLGMSLCENLEKDLSGHLLRYPVEITRDGDVKEFRGMEYFPDTQARILGAKCDMMPLILTT